MKQIEKLFFFKYNNAIKDVYFKIVNNNNKIPLDTLVWLSIQEEKVLKTWITYVSFSFRKIVFFLYTSVVLNV